MQRGVLALVIAVGCVLGTDARTAPYSYVAGASHIAPRATQPAPGTKRTGGHSYRRYRPTRRTWRKAAWRPAKRVIRAWHPKARAVAPKLAAATGVAGGAALAQATSKPISETPEPIPAAAQPTTPVEETAPTPPPKTAAPQKKAPTATKPVTASFSPENRVGGADPSLAHAAKKPVRKTGKPVAKATGQATGKAAGAKTTFLPDYQEPKKAENSPSLLAVIFDLFIKLAVVLGVAYASVLGLRKYMNQQGAALPGRGRLLKVIESVSIGPNRSLHLVRVAGKVVVIGSTPENISLIAEIHDSEGTPQLETVSAEGSANGFSSLLTHALKDETLSDERKPEIPEQVHNSIKHLWDRVEELRTMRGGKGGSR